MNYDEHVKLQQLFERLKTIVGDLHDILTSDLAGMIASTTIVRFGDDCRRVDLTLLDTKIEDLELSVRTRNCLYDAKILHVGSLAAETRKSLSDIQGFGPKCLREVEAWLHEKNLSLGAVYYDWLPPERDADAGVSKDR